VPLTLGQTTGNVGIGTPSPSYPLQVTGQTYIGMGAANTTHGLLVGNNSCTLSMGAMVDGTGPGINAQSWSLSLQTAGTTRVYLGSGGGVGIGTTTLTGNLTVNGGGTDHMLNFRGDPTSFGLIAGSGIVLQPVKSDQSATTAMTIYSTGLYLMGGAVGIGTQAPGYALDVTGDVNCTGNFRVAGAPIAQPNSAVTVNTSADWSVPTSAADVPGLTYTAPKAGTYLVICTVQILSGTDVNNLTNLYCYVAGGAHYPVMQWAPGTNTGSQGTITGHWVVAGVAANSVFKMQAAHTSGAGNSQIAQYGSLSVIWISP
jgi:hypothetical protein